MSRKVLLLVGSPRGKRSTSYSVGSYLLNKLMEDGGVETESLNIQSSLREGGGMAMLESGIDEADIVILAFPLYVDSLPAAVIRMMERIAGRERTREQTLAVIVNCGFPEARHNDTAVEIARKFAEEADFSWAGALAFGQGGTISGRPVDGFGGLTRNLLEALDLAARALREGKSIPEEAVELARKQFIPHALYVKMGALGWNAEARKNKSQKRLYDKPYQKKDI